MIEPGKQPNQGSPVRQPVLLGLFVGTAVGAGYLLAGVPNVELMTLVIALSGAALGPVAGVVCGALSALIYSLGSPYGLPVPVLLAAQMTGMGLAGLVGWRLAAWIKTGRRMSAAVTAALGGFCATFMYDLLTTLATLAVFDLDPRVVFTGAIPFAAWHLGVNAALFAVLFPQLAPRLRLLGRSQLKGEGRILLALLVLPVGLLGVPDAGAQTAPALPDSLNPSLETASDIPPPPAGGPAVKLGWQRPLWHPFALNLMQEMTWRGAWLPVVDGGLGSSTALLGEAGTSLQPLVLRDGLPVGTGHLLADDPWLVAGQATTALDQHLGADGWGGTDGLLNLGTVDSDPTKAVSYYRGAKGPHESYQRAVSVLTPKAAWRMGFDFEENTDIEGYNYTDGPDGDFYGAGEEFPGHARIRQTRAVMSRQLDPHNSLQLEYTTARKTKDSLPVMGADHQEIWDSGASATMLTRWGPWSVRSAFFFRARDVEWGDRIVDTEAGNLRRKISTGRQGVVLDLFGAGRQAAPAAVTGPDADSPVRRGTGLRLIYTDWDVRDTGVDWVPDMRLHDSGQSLRLAGTLATDLAGLDAGAGLSGNWHSGPGAAPGGWVSLGAAGAAPWWRASLSREGRAPRSDELLTPLDRHVNARTFVILPNADLDFEKTLRAQLQLQSKVLGLDLAADGSLRRLTDGITWVADPVETDTGRLSNALTMNSTRLTASVGRQGRFLGWGRIKLQGTWRSFDETAARAAFLPPKQQLRLELMWENHFFQEDGILQLALFSTHQGEMADPWDPSRSQIIPAATLHDLVVGFRLAGAHLSLAFRNLTDQRVQQTAAAWTPGRELDLRLNWTFLY